MATATYFYQVGTVGQNFQSTGTITSVGEVITNPATIGPAGSGTLSTRTNNTSGVLTMTPGHGIITGNIDLYWGTGKRIKVAASVSTNTITISSGSGDNLPLQGVAITAMNQVQAVFSIANTANVIALLGSCNAAQATATIYDGSDDLLTQMNMRGSSGSYIWDSNTGAPSPLTDFSTATYVLLSHGDSSTAQQVNVIALTN